MTGRKRGNIKEKLKTKGGRERKIEGFKKEGTK